MFSVGRKINCPSCTCVLFIELTAIFHALASLLVWSMANSPQLSSFPTKFAVVFLKTVGQSLLKEIYMVLH